MERIKNLFASILSFVLLFLLASAARAQLNVGDYTINGGAEVGGMWWHKNGQDSKFLEYRDLREQLVVPEIQLQIDRKQNDFYMDLDTTKTGYNDQYYRARFGRYGLLDMEFEWNQIPHFFDKASTPFQGSEGHEFSYTLSSKASNAPLPNSVFPSGATSPIGPGQCAGGASLFCNWLTANSHEIDLKILRGIGTFNLRYTPTPGWTFTGNYSSQNTTGKRAIGAYIGTSPGTFNITEMPEPIDYQTHNVELGGEYAGKGWSVGLKYNLSLFHNSFSSMIWDNPIQAGVGASCVDSPYAQTTGTTIATGALTSAGPCRTRMDLYPSNRTHTITLSGAAVLPLQSRFMGAVSYGWRLQDDSFLPFTTNRCFTSNPALVGTLDATKCVTGAGAASPLLALPTISNSNLGGDIRPLMVNATLTNNFFRFVNLKAYERFYDLGNHSNQISMPNGFIVNDSGTGSGTPELFSYSKNNLGAEGGFDITRWLSAKLGYNWERMHRVIEREITNSDEHSVGPTVDIKPLPWTLFRASYRYFTRDDPGYQDGTVTNISRKFDEAARRRHKSSLLAQLTPWDPLELHAGFEFTGDHYPDTVLGQVSTFGYSPSIGFVYTPLDWLRFFGDYNWDRSDWKLDAMQRGVNQGATLPTGTAQTPQTNPLLVWNSGQRDETHTISIGSDMDIIRDLLTFRLQYTLANSRTTIKASGDGPGNATAGTPTTVGLPVTGATNYPTFLNVWHEFLARLEYKISKNVSVKFSYYFNHLNEHDRGVDTMQQWMGAVIDPNLANCAVGNGFCTGTVADLQRSIFLSDQMKGPFTVHAGFLSVAFKF